METVSAAIGIKNPARRIIAVPEGARTRTPKGGSSRARWLLASGQTLTRSRPVETRQAERPLHSEFVLVEFDGERKDLHFVASCPNEHLAQVSYIAQGSESVIYCAGLHVVNEKPWVTASRLPNLSETHDPFHQAVTMGAAVASTTLADGNRTRPRGSIQAMDLSGGALAIGVPQQLQLIDAETLRTQWHCDVDCLPRTVPIEHGGDAALDWTCTCFADSQSPALLLGAHASGPVFLFDTRQAPVARMLEASFAEAPGTEVPSRVPKAYEILPDCPSGLVRLSASRKHTAHSLCSTVLALARLPQRHSAVLASTDDGMLLSLDLSRDAAGILLKEAATDRSEISAFASALAVQLENASLRTAIAAYGIHQEPIVSIWRGMLDDVEAKGLFKSDSVAAAEPAAAHGLSSTGAAVDKTQRKSMALERQFRDHDELIIALEWHAENVQLASSADEPSQHLFASLSADGRLVVRTIPVMRFSA
jgi:hypothetical protein